VSWLGLLVSEVTLCRPRFNPRPVKLTFVLDKVTLEPMSVWFRQCYMLTFRVTTFSLPYCGKFRQCSRYAGIWGVNAMTYSIRFCCCSCLVLVYLWLLLQSTYYLKDFSCRNLKCKNWEIFKESQVQEPKYFYLIKKIESIKIGVHIKVKSILHFMNKYQNFRFINFDLLFEFKNILFVWLCCFQDIFP
jgi:hypothetical protein